VNFPGNADLIGRFVRVKITSAGKNTLRGAQLGEPSERSHR
ncbi:MAG: TRAM domain-containing protein, partial [Clostridiales bacterium]|nr:TRAM domain-containing protein [Clostridiales bacterium]